MNNKLLFVEVSPEKVKVEYGVERVRALEDKPKTKPKKKRKKKEKK